MEVNLGEKYKVLGSNVVKLILWPIAYLILSVVLIGNISPAFLKIILDGLGTGIFVDTSTNLTPGVVQYILMAVVIGLVLASIYCILGIFMNKFKMYENVFVIKRPFRTKTVVIADIQSLSAVRQTNRWGFIPVSIVDVFSFCTTDKEGKSVVITAKSGHYFGLKRAMIAYDKKYNKGWF